MLRYCVTNLYSPQQRIPPSIAAFRPVFYTSSSTLHPSSNLPQHPGFAKISLNATHQLASQIASHLMP